MRDPWRTSSPLRPGLGFRYTQELASIRRKSFAWVRDRKSVADVGRRMRARVIEWYRSTLLSRGDDKTKTRIVVVMQRVHQNDLVGYLEEQGGFEVSRELDTN